MSYNECVLMYKVVNNLTPSYLKSHRLVSEVHSRTTRASVSDDYAIPKHRTEHVKNVFFTKGQRYRTNGQFKLVMWVSAQF